MRPPVSHYFLRTSPKAFQQTINTDAKITMVTVSRRYVPGAALVRRRRRGAPGLPIKNRIVQTGTLRSNALPIDLDVSESEFDDMRLDDIE
jgi:hypothetical protein